MEIISTFHGDYKFRLHVPAADNYNRLMVKA